MGVSVGGGAQRSSSRSANDSASYGAQSSQQGSQQSTRQTTPQELQAYFNQVDAVSGGRLGNWAQNGTAAVNYDTSAAAPVAYGGDVSGRVSALLGSTGPVAYQGVTANQIQALGGLGASRSLAANQAYADRAAQLLSDPSMTLAQRQYAGGLNTRELAQTQDAIKQESEAAIAQMAQEEALRGYNAAAADRAAAMAGQGSALTAEQEQAARQYAAAAADRTAAMAAAQNDYAARVRNADLSRTDMQTLAELLARFFGSSSSGSSWGTSFGENSSQSTGRGTSSGDGWNFNLALGGK